MHDPSAYVLSIEAAIAGGSLSLIQGDTAVSNWLGTSAATRAEELLTNIHDLLMQSNCDADELGLITVSAGPGSFTGIRIGLATGRGLARGYDIKMVTVSALQAMAALYAPPAPTVVAVPVGRGAVAIQRFPEGYVSTASAHAPCVVEENEFLVSLDRNTDAVYVLHSLLAVKVPDRSYVIDAGANVAETIGRFALVRPDLISAPMFLSKDF